MILEPSFLSNRIKHVYVCHRLQHLLTRLEEAEHITFDAIQDRLGIQPQTLRKHLKQPTRKFIKRFLNVFTIGELSEEYVLEWIFYGSHGPATVDGDCDVFDSRFMKESERKIIRKLVAALLQERKQI